MMDLTALSLFLLLTSGRNTGALGKVVTLSYVSTKGRDFPGCGKMPTTPCRSIIYVTTVFPSTTHVYIEGGNTFNECQSSMNNMTGFVLENITVCGYNIHDGIPIISCQPPFGVKEASDTGSWEMLFTNVSMTNIKIRLINTQLRISRSNFYNVSLETVSKCKHLSIELEEVTFNNGHGTCGLLECNQLGDHFLVCENITANVLQSYFWDTSTIMVATVFSDIFITDSVFSKRRPQETGIGGLNITIPLVNGSLRVCRCEFTQQVHHDPVLSAINIESAALRIESCSNRRHNASARVHVSDCVFQGNERALSISSPFLKIEIRRCVFSENRAMHAAPAIRLALGDNTAVIIEDSSFANNIAGATHYSNKPGVFEVNNHQVWVNSSQYKGSISLVGKGGALRIHRALVTITNCSFFNNTARSLGGSIFVGRGSKLTVEKTSFIGTTAHKHSTQGDILYSNGQLMIIQSMFKVASSLDHVAALHHSGEHWSMEVDSLVFMCPVGHNAMLVNATSHRIQKNVGLKKSHKLDQSSYYCQTCGGNHYSLQSGYLNYTALNNNTEYFTLLIDGSQPFKFHPISFEHNNISCLKCPYGAVCDGQITTISNFWGYVDQGHAVFQHCPPGYCCSSEMCASFNTCAENREGRLCGRCMSGFSEAMFSPRCIADSDCNNKWIWPFTLFMGIIYALFLVFLREIRAFMLSWSVNLTGATRKRFCLNNKTSHSKMYGKEEERHTSDTQTHTDYGKDGLSPNQKLHLEADENNLDKDNRDKKKEAGFLIIMFYYFQDALLLHVDTIYTGGTSKFEKQLKPFMVGLFKFQLDFYQFFEHVCILRGTQPATKQLLRTIFVPYILILLGIFYLCNIWFRMIAIRHTGSVVTQSSWTSGRFSSKLACGFILAMMFTYQKMATATFTLLNCVPIGNESVLFIDGTHTCFQPWQFGVMVYAFTCVVPFSIVLMLGPPLLKNSHISLTSFFLGCLCPFPFLLHWLVKCTYKGKNDRKTTPTIDTQAVLEILQAPFKERSHGHIIGQLCWSGVLLGRRLILFLCFTFINDILVRLLCMVFVCFVILIQHIYIQPYKTTMGNLAGSVSAAALLVVGGINILRATFESAEYHPRGPNNVLMTVFEKVENILVLWLPLAALCIILIGLIVKLSVWCFATLQSKCTCISSGRK